MARIADQIATVSPFVEKMVIWEFGHYLAPGRSRESLELYLDYLNYRLGNPLLGPISRGAGYVLSSTPDSSYPDETGVQLTDGQARFGSWDPVGWKGTSPISITLDLGGQRKNIYQFRALFLNSESLGGSPPERVAVLISSEGEVFDVGVRWKRSWRATNRITFRRFPWSNPPRGDGFASRFSRRAIPSSAASSRPAPASTILLRFNDYCRWEKPYRITPAPSAQYPIREEN